MRASTPIQRVTEKTEQVKPKERTEEKDPPRKSTDKKRKSTTVLSESELNSRFELSTSEQNTSKATISDNTAVTPKSRTAAMVGNMQSLIDLLQ